MQHAVLMTVHNNETVCKTLIKLLDDERFTFFILLDEKSPLDYKDFLVETEYSEIVCLPRIKVNWAGVSQITAELDLMETALTHSSTTPPDFLHFLQGADLPLKTPQEMDGFFSTHDSEFVDFQPHNFEFAKYKVQCKHFFTDMPSYRTNKLLKLMNHGIARLQLPFVDKSEQQYHGSALFSVTRQFAQTLVDDREWIEKRYKRSLAADEVFMQNYIMNSDFRVRVSKEYSNARLIDWVNREGNSPKTFTEADKEELLKAMDTEGLCFARKFVADRDSNIIRFVENEMMERKKCNAE